MSRTLLTEARYENSQDEWNLGNQSAMVNLSARVRSTLQLRIDVESTSKNMRVRVYPISGPLTRN